MSYNTNFVAFDITGCISAVMPFLGELKVEMDVEHPHGDCVIWEKSYSADKHWMLVRIAAIRQNGEWK